MQVENAMPAKKSTLNSNQRKGHCYSYEEIFDGAGNWQGHRSLLNTEAHLTVLKPKHNDSRH